MTGTPVPHVVIVGAGMSGIAMAIALQDAGLTDFTILEKGDSVGGTWRDNRYPGVACDVAARCYTYSFAPNPAWTRVLPGGAEIHRYFQSVAGDHGLSDQIRLNTEVTEATWTGSGWDIVTAGGEHIAADVLITACGILHHPVIPDLPGLDTFAGPAFHTARWMDDEPLAGRRIGVIGTGSTGAQLTGALGGVASKLTVFQRTAQWMLPLPNRSYTRASRFLHGRFDTLNRLSHRAYTRLYDLTFSTAVVQPGWQRKLLALLCELNLRRVKDPALRAKLTPSDAPMCRRLVMSWDYYRAVQRPDVEVVSDAIQRIVPEGVVTADGRVHELDVLVLATGFDARAFMRPIELVGQDGVRLSDVWGAAPKAFRTVAMPQFPNFFMLIGPHSPIGNQSLIAIAECQAAYIVQLVQGMSRGDYAALAPRQDVTEHFNQQLREAMPKTAWLSGCTSWYLDEDGVPMLWPWSPRAHAQMLRAPLLEEFEIQATRE